MSAKKLKTGTLHGHPLTYFEGVGHLPQLEAPGRFVAVLERFLEETEPAQFDAERWRARFQTTAKQSIQGADAA